MSRAGRTPRVLPRSFYRRPTLTVAGGLLGKVLVRRTPQGLTAGRIVEVEAYIGEADPACHAAAGPTARNAPLYGVPGHAYVYVNYGVHFLVNAVTERRGFPAAVLIRALEPVAGLGLMRARRGRRRDGRDIGVDDLCRGPGNLAKAMGVGRDLNLADLTKPGRAGGALWIEDRGDRVADVIWTPRIGIRVGTRRPWRCYVAGSPAVSGRRRYWRLTGRSRIATTGTRNSIRRPSR